MGLSFSNIQVYMERPLDEALAGRIAEILVEGKVKPKHMVHSFDDAPAMRIAEFLARIEGKPWSVASHVDVTVCASKGSPWVTVWNERANECLEELLRITFALSKALETRVLAIRCSDSELLCLKIVDKKRDIDFDAFHGNLKRGVVPHIGGYEVWRDYVKNIRRFMNVVQTPSVYAEDALYVVADELDLPAEQAFCTKGKIPKDAQVFEFVAI